MNRERKIVLTLIASLWVSMPLYLLLHEGGHVLVAKWCGARIVEFNLFEAYVIAEGGSFNKVSLAMFDAAGMLMPVSVFTLYLISYKGDKKQAFYRIFSAFFTGMNLFSIGVWVVIPIKYMMGTANVNDDVTKFIEVSKIHPIKISLIASVVLGIYSLIIWRKKVFQNGYEALRQKEDKR